MPSELRNFKVTKIALVRKGYRPVNAGATIEIVKAQQEEPVIQPAPAESVMERLVKALQGVFASPAAPADATIEKAAHSPAEATPAASPATVAETPTRPVAKSQEATQTIADDGAHGDMNGIHGHVHTHSTYGFAADGTDAATLTTHSHEHVHNGDASHFHAYDPGHEGPDPVAKATLELGLKVDALIARLDAAEVVTKAALAETRVRELIAADLATAFEPVAKALEDLGIEKARLPLTPNVTSTIAPNPEPAAKAAEKAAAVQTMSYSDALRHLLHS
jgi:hypothetical protein